MASASFLIAGAAIGQNNHKIIQLFPIFFSPYTDCKLLFIYVETLQDIFKLWRQDWQNEI